MRQGLKSLRRLCVKIRRVGVCSARVESFLFILVSQNSKLYETGQRVAVSPSFDGLTKLHKIRIYKEMCFQLFRKTKNNSMFLHSFLHISFFICAFSLCFVPLCTFFRVSYLNSIVGHNGS